MTLFNIIFFLLVFIISYSAEATRQCNTQPNQTLSLIEQSTEAHCILIRDSDQCKELYKKIDQTTNSREEAQKMKLNCSPSKSDGGLKFTGDIALGCASGLIIDPVMDLGRFIGVSAAKAVESFRQARECDKSLEEKSRFIVEYNLSVPYFLQFPATDPATLKDQSCAQVQVRLLNHKTNINKRLNVKYGGVLSTEPSKIKAKYGQLGQDYYNYLNKKGESSPGFNLLEKIKEIQNNFFAGQACYSPQQQAKINCEIAGFIASAAIPGALALRAQKLATLSGRKVDDFLNYMNQAQRATPGVAGRLTNKAEQDYLLSLASQLTDTERVQVFEKIFNRKMELSESQQLIKIHQVGSDQGRGIGSYIPEDILEKRRLAKEINPTTGKPYFNLEEQKVLLRNGITGSFKYDNAKLSQLENEVRSSMSRDAKAKLGFADSQQIKDILKEAFTSGYSFSTNEIQQMMSRLNRLGVHPDKTKELAEKLTGDASSSGSNYIVQYERALNQSHTVSTNLQRLAADSYSARGSAFEQTATDLYKKHLKTVQERLESRTKSNLPIGERDLIDVYSAALKAGETDRAVKYYQSLLKKKHATDSRSEGIKYETYIKDNFQYLKPGEAMSGVWRTRHCAFVTQLARAENIDPSYAGYCR